MSLDTNNPPPENSGLQFDKAVFNNNQPSKLTCFSCHQEIRKIYFEINGKVFCAPCKEKVEAALYEGSRVRRIFLAVIAGTGAAFLGAGLYYGIERLTDHQFGLVAILVGFMVGAAVRWGSKGRGGWGYQLLAMFLTYNALVLTYLPSILEEYTDLFKKEPAASTLPSALLANPIQGTPKPAEESPTNKTTEKIPSDTPAEGSIPVQPPISPPSMSPSPSNNGTITPGSGTVGTKSPSSTATQNPSPVTVEISPTPSKADANALQSSTPTGPLTPAIIPISTPSPLPTQFKKLTSSRMIRGLGALLLLAYMLPYLTGAKNIVGLFLIGIGLYEAWKINSKPRFVIKGPFQAGPPEPQ